MNNDLFNEEENELLKYFLNKKYFQKINKKNKDWTNTNINFTIQINNFEMYKNNLNLFLNYLLNNKIIILNINLYLNKLAEINLEEIFIILENYYNSIPLFILQNYDLKIKIILNNKDINSNLKLKNYEIIFEKLFQHIKIEYNIYFYSLNIDNKYFNDIIDLLKNKNFIFYFLIYQKELNSLKTFFDEKITIFLDKNLSLLSLQFIENKKEKWNNDNIDYFLNFIKYYFDRIILYNKNNIQDYLLNPNFQYFYFFKNQNIKKYLNINLQDLSFIPDIELFDPQFKAGYLKDNKIIALSGLSTFLQLEFLNSIFLPMCNECNFNKICQRNKISIQYEVTGEILLPIKEICLLEKKKLLTLFEICKKYNLLNYISNNNILLFFTNYNN